MKVRLTLCKQQRPSIKELLILSDASAGIQKSLYQEFWPLIDRYSILM